ncbi:MAG: Na+/H+ antiporter subunit E, partial [Pseudoalteromonas sp.]
MRLESRFRWLPTPFRSVLLFVVWLLLNNSVSPGHLVLAAFFAITIPWITFPFREPQPLILRPTLALKQLVVVLLDIVTANVQVALLIIGPVKKLRPGFVKIPLDLKHEIP